jgi:very-short-patch-repair endonuclease
VVPERRAAHKAATATPEFAQKSREALLKRLPAMRRPATNTAIEQRMHDALKVAGIGFAGQSLLGRHLVDIELHQAPIVIEADGQQHTLRIQKAKDAARDAELTDAGYRVFRFTGREINTDATACVQRVIDACGLTPDKEPTYNIRTKFSGELHPLWKGGTQEYIYESCGNVFLAQPKHRAGKHVYCSRQCYGKAKVGVKLGPMPAEQRAKIGAANRHAAAERKHRLLAELAGRSLPDERAPPVDDLDQALVFEDGQRPPRGIPRHLVVLHQRGDTGQPRARREVAGGDPRP